MKSILRLNTPLLLGLALLFSSACAKDSFTLDTGKPTIGAWYEGESSPYDEVITSDTTTIDGEVEGCGEISTQINLGDVPVYGSKTAVFELANQGDRSLLVNSANYDSIEAHGDNDWGQILWRENASDNQLSKFPVTVPARSTRLILVPFAPSNLGSARSLVKIATNGNPRNVCVEVIANGIYQGEPEIEIEYNGLAVPSLDSCTDGKCVVQSDKALNFGNVGLEMTSTLSIKLRNKAACAAFPNLDPCLACNLIVDENANDGYSVGLGFKPGTNDNGYFKFATSTATPFNVQQPNPECQRGSGELVFPIEVTAPATEQLLETVIVIESNDPDEKIIEIPVRANAKNAPIAIARPRICGETVNDTEGPMSSICGDEPVEPLTIAFFDATNSYDPNGEEITSYDWEIVAGPDGVNPADYDETPLDSGKKFAFYIPLAGTYTIRLTVKNESGVTSGDTEDARVTFQAVPGSMLHIQVVWDHPTNDQDLHVTHLSANGGNDSFFSTQYDCYWQEKKPVWFSTHPSGEGPNPRLDVDDRDGSGPENVNIDRPNPGIYRTFVHYFPESGWDFNSGASDPTIQTVKIYLAGILAFSKQRTLTQEKQVWAVADVTWYAGATEEDPGYGTVTQFPASRDNPSEIGQIAIMDNTASECRTVMGCDFPEN